MMQSGALPAVYDPMSAPPPADRESVCSWVAATNAYCVDLVIQAAVAAVVVAATVTGAVIGTENETVITEVVTVIASVAVVAPAVAMTTMIAENVIEVIGIGEIDRSSLPL